MSALASSLSYDFGDQFSYPTIGGNFDEPDHTLITASELPTRPMAKIRIKEFTKSKFTIGQFLWRMDEVFPPATTLRHETLDVDFLLQLSGDSEEAPSVEKEILDYRSFPENWDGYGASTPEPEVVSCAVHVVRNFPSELPAPEPTLTHDGTVALDILDGNFRSRCTIEVMPGRRVIYSLTVKEKVVAGSFALNGDSEMIAALGMLAEQLS